MSAELDSQLKKTKEEFERAVDHLQKEPWRLTHNSRPAMGKENDC